MLVFLLITAGFLIALGFTPVPLFPDSLGHGTGWLYWPIGVISVTALLPLALAILKATMRRPLNKLVAAGFAIVAGIIGTILSFLYATLTGIGTLLAVIHGLSLTLAVTTSILMLAAQSRPSPLKTAFAILLIIPVIVAVWSLISGGAVIWQTNRLADSRSFCVALHDRGSAVRSYAQLRGLSFYTTASGYKNTPRWYFHGLLIVETQNGNDTYNWSPRRMKFQRIDYPERFFASPVEACLPREGFWETLSVF